MGKMEIFKSIKSLRALTVLLRASNLHTDSITIRGVKVPGWIFTVVHSVPMLWQVYLTYVFCKQSNYDLGAVSGSICISCGIVQILLMYVCLMLKKNLIVSSIGLLQDTVNERKYSIKRYVLFPLVIYLWLVPHIEWKTKNFNLQKTFDRT